MCVFFFRYKNRMCIFRYLIKNVERETTISSTAVAAKWIKKNGAHNTNARQQTYCVHIIFPDFVKLYSIWMNVCIRCVHAYQLHMGTCARSRPFQKQNFVSILFFFFYFWGQKSIFSVWCNHVFGKWSRYLIV